MSFSFKKAKIKIIEGDFESDGQILHVKVNANAMSVQKMEEVHKRIAAKMNKADAQTGLNESLAQVAGIAAMLELVIDDWDAEEGKPEFEFLKTLPLPLLSDLMQFCVALASPKAMTAKK